MIKRVLFFLACGIAGFAIAGAVSLAMMGRDQYLSTAVIRFASSPVPERFIPGNTSAALQATVNDVMQAALSRSALVYLVNNHGLYQGERARMPMEVVIERMRADIGITAIGAADAPVLKITYRYDDRMMAQKVTQTISDRLMSHAQTERFDQARHAERFLEDQVELAARAWDALKTAGSRGAADRAALDLDMARRQYIAMKEKLSEAMLARRLLERQQGATLELIDPASLPVRAENDKTAAMVGGTLAGLVGGAVMLWRRARQRRNQAVVGDGALPQAAT